mgnify:CR=1 FL=1
MTRFHAPARGAIVALLACALVVPGSALALEIRFRSFSGSAAIGPPADAYAVKLRDISTTVIGPAGEIRFTKITPMPAIPGAFGGDIVLAVGAGSAGGGFDAAYTSGSELNRAWGFIYNSGVPFGPNFDEHLGFLYGKSVEGGSMTGLELIQSVLDLNNRNVVVVPIVVELTVVRPGTLIATGMDAHWMWLKGVHPDAWKGLVPADEPPRAELISR